MNFEEIKLEPLYTGFKHCLNATILVRKNNTDNLSYYLENDDDMLEVVYRERSGCDGVLSGCTMKPYTWNNTPRYHVLVGEDLKFEDPRLWLYGSKKYISFSYYPMILFGEYNKNVSSIVHLPIGRNFSNGLEKNWGFFEHEGRLCMVYYPSPLIIIEMIMNDKDFQIVNISESMCEELGVGICGGSPPVLYPYGDEKIYYIFVHKTIIQNNYNIWCVAFTETSQGKWKIKGFTKERLNSGDPGQISFVNGAIYDKQKNQWLLSGGYRDQVIGFWSISHAELASKMSWLF